MTHSNFRNFWQNNYSPLYSSLVSKWNDKNTSAHLLTKILWKSTKCLLKSIACVREIRYELVKFVEIHAVIAELHHTFSCYPWDDGWNPTKIYWIPQWFFISIKCGWFQPYAYWSLSQICLYPRSVSWNQLRNIEIHLMFDETWHVFVEIDIPKALKNWVR